MNTFLKSIFAAVIGIAVLWQSPAHAQDENALIAVLQSNASPQQKDAACQRLKNIGTAKCVPALAKLLVDGEMSFSARYALEVIPGPEAGAVLRDALANTKGLTKAGIIESLGTRRDAQTVALVRNLVTGEDSAAAAAAASALGQIGGADAIAALQAAKDQTAGDLHSLVVNSLLLCADRLLAANNANAATSLYKEVYESEKARHHRIAAYRGMVLSVGGDNAIALVVGGVSGTEHAAVEASLQLAREIKGEAATKAFAAAISKAHPAVQIALIGSLAQRGDSAASPAIVECVKSDEPALRKAALAALGSVGDASAVGVLADAAARETGATQETARQSLALVRGSGIRDAMLAQLTKASPAAQAEIVRALGQRQDVSAVPALIKLAASNDQATRILAIKSLGQLADASQAGQLIGLLTSARSNDERTAAENALIAASARGDSSVAAGPLLAALKNASAAPMRAALVRIVGRLDGAEPLAAVRAALNDSDPTVRDAALRTMGEYGPLEAAADLLKIASDAQQSTNARVIALRGYWRIVGSAENISLDDRWRMCQTGFAACQRLPDKQLALSEIAKVPHLEALKLTQGLWADEAVRSEAENASLRIAIALAGSNPVPAKAALRQLASAARSEEIRSEAKKALAAMDRYVGFITAWSVAGPYRQAGKQCAELFDIAFAPEQRNAKVQWKRLASPADASLFWQADLLPVCDGEQCVVYVKARVFSPSRQDVLLEIGSDDGNKIWINGKLVHSKNVMRPIQAGQDTSQAQLKEGWNDFLVKVTQNNMGCAVCIRIRAADGSIIDGLKFDAGM